VKIDILFSIFVSYILPFMSLVFPLLLFFLFSYSLSRYSRESTGTMRFFVALVLVLVVTIWRISEAARFGHPKPGDILYQNTLKLFGLAFAVAASMQLLRVQEIRGRSILKLFVLILAALWLIPTIIFFSGKISLAGLYDFGSYNSSVVGIAWLYVTLGLIARRHLRRWGRFSFGLTSIAASIIFITPLLRMYAHTVRPTGITLQASFIAGVISGTVALLLVAYVAVTTFNSIRERGVKTLLSADLVLRRGRGKELLPTIAAVTIVLLTTVIYIGYRLTEDVKKVAIEQFNQQQLLMARQTARGIEGYFEEIERTLRMAARSPRIQRMEERLYPQKMEDIWEQRLPGRLGGLLLTNGDGKLEYILPETELSRIGEDLSGSEFFGEAKRTGRIYVTRFRKDKKGEYKLIMALPVYDTVKDEKDPNPSGDFRGVIAAVVDLSIIIKLYIDPIATGRTATYAYLLSDEGICLFQPGDSLVGQHYSEYIDPERFPRIWAIDTAMVKGEEGTGWYWFFEHKKGKYRELTRIKKFIAYSPVKVEDKLWSIGITTPAEEVEGIIQSAYVRQWGLIGFFILLIVAGFGVAIFISTRWGKTLELEVDQRTSQLRELNKQLEAKVEELEKFKRITIDRELKMIQLKERLKQLGEEV